MKEGKDLIRYFCTHCKETKSNGGRSRNFPRHAPDKWKLFKSYNKRDVEVEVAIQKRLKNYPVPEQVWDEYHLDQEINDRGIAIDRTLVSQAVAMDARCRESLMGELKKKRIKKLSDYEETTDYLSADGGVCVCRQCRKPESNIARRTTHCQPQRQGRHSDL